MPLVEMLERVEKATGPDRDLDRALMALAYDWGQRHIGAICWDDGHDTCCKDAKHIDLVWIDRSTDKWVTTAVQGFEFTGSVDCVLALAERALPGWRVNMVRGESYSSAQFMKGWGGGKKIGPAFERPDDELPLAILAALLAAIIAKEAGNA